MSTGSRDTAYWRRYLRDVPDWMLGVELDLRVAEHRLRIELPGLTIDAAASRVRWGGDDFDVFGREMEVLYLLGQQHRDGIVHVGRDLVALRIWRGYPTPSARASLSTTLFLLRKRFAGLILSSPRTLPEHAWLALDLEPAPAIETKRSA